MHSIELCMVWTVPEIILLLEPWIVSLFLEFWLGEDLRLFLFLDVLVLVLLKNVLVINLIPSSIDIVVSSSITFCIVETPNATCVFYHVTFTLWQHIILWHYLDAEMRDCIMISFHISFYASVAFHLHFSMSN